MQGRKRTVVTGGAGHIGSHLCERLLKAGHEVLCVDNFYSGQKSNITPFLANPDFELLRHDITQPLLVEADWVFNLACPASPVHYQKDPVQTTRTNVAGTLNMLDLAHHAGARILQASTSEIYGDPTVHPQPESYRGNVNSIGPRACYNEGKRVAETLLFDYHRQYALSIKVARIFNTYGPRMRPDDGRVISNFIVQALRGEPLTIYGTGRQTRSFCYVDDIVTGLLLLMEAPEDFTGPVNLGQPNEISIGELARRIAELTGTRAEIRNEPLPEDDPTRRCPDIALARERLDWNPQISLDDGLKRTIAYFKDE